MSKGSGLPYGATIAIFEDLASPESAELWLKVKPAVDRSIATRKSQLQTHAVAAGRFGHRKRSVEAASALAALQDAAGSAAHTRGREQLLQRLAELQRPLKLDEVVDVACAASPKHAEEIERSVRNEVFVPWVEEGTKHHRELLSASHLPILAVKFRDRTEVIHSGRLTESGLLDIVRQLTGK